MRRRINAEVIIQLAVHVLQAARNRAHVWRRREGEADRVAGRRVGVLPDDEHSHVGERALKRRENAIARWQHPLTARALLVQKSPKLGKLPLDRRERLGPVGSYEAGLGQLLQVHGHCHALSHAFASSGPRWV